MNLLASFLVLASGVGCFPTTRSFLADTARNTLKIRHFIIPALLLLYVQLDYADFAGRYFDSSASLSAKLEYIFSNAVYYLCDTYVRAFTFIYGSDLCTLIRNMRLTKEDILKAGLSKCHQRLEQNNKFYIILTLVIFCMQFIHMPLRCYEWWTMHSYPGDSTDYWILPKPPILRLPLLAAAEFAGIICRNIPLALVIFLGLDLLEIYETLLAKLINREELNGNDNKSEDLMMDLDLGIQTSPLDGELGNETMEVIQLKRLENCFKEYNRIVGAYATIIIGAFVGNFIIEVMTLCSITKEPISSVMNTVAGVFGSLIGILFIYIITSMGQLLEKQVRESLVLAFF